MIQIWQDLPLSMQDTATRPLFAMSLSLNTPKRLMLSPAGERRVVGVCGGRFGGAIPGLSGRVLPGGLDWVVIDGDGTARLDAKLVLETDACQMILMSYSGIRHAPPEIARRIADGLLVDPAEYYFRIVPQFITTAPGLEWLNRIIAVGSGHRLPDDVTYSIFELL